MSSIPEDQLIGQKEASQILGFKTNQMVSKYIKEGILKTYPKKGSKRNWFDLEEVQNLPEPLPAALCRQLAGSKTQPVARPATREGD